jgi:hypothetical protein
MDDRRRRALVDRDRVEARDLRVRAEAGEDRAEVRDRQPADDLVADEDAAWFGPLRVISSMAANLAGWSSNTARAAKSPTTTWIGAMIAATTNGIANPSRT